MKLSISNIAWAKEDDEQMYGFLTENGYSGLEIAPMRLLSDPYNHLDEAAVFAEKLRANYGLEIPSVQSIWFGRTEKIFGDEKDRNTLIEYSKKAILFAEAIGCKNLVFGNPKNRDTDLMKSSYLPIAVEFFKNIGDFALLHNTFIAVEANPSIYGTRFLNTTEEAVEFIRQVPSKGLRINLDLGTMVYNNEKLSIVTEMVTLINHVHISEPYLEVIRERAIHKDFLKILKVLNYKNYISIEMKNNGNLEVVKQRMLYLRQCIGAIGC